jgi:hypothetical protein
MWYNVALATTLMAFALSSCQTVVRNMPTQMSATKLACDPTTKRCQTPEFGLRKKPRQGQRVSWKVETPPGWQLTGNPNARLCRQGHQRCDRAGLGCQFADLPVACGKHQSSCLRQGGWVAGYCYAEGADTAASSSKDPGAR